MFYFRIASELVTQRYPDSYKFVQHRPSMLMDSVGIYEDPSITQSMEVLKSRPYFSYPDGWFQVKNEQGSNPTEQETQHCSLMAHVPPAFTPFAFPPPMMHPVTPAPFRFYPNQTPTQEQEQYAQGFFELAAKTMQQQQQKATGGVSEHMYPGFGMSQGATTAYPHTTPSLGMVAQTYANLTNPDLSVKSHLAYVQMMEAESTASSPYSSREDLRTVPNTSHLAIGSPAGSEIDVYGTSVMHEAIAEVPDMMDQEKIKGERKKARNRIAAKKCRNSRLQRESDLEECVRELSEQQDKLQDERSHLVEAVNHLKLTILEHLRNGCAIEIPADIDLTVDSRSSPACSSEPSPAEATVQA